MWAETANCNCLVTPSLSPSLSPSPLLLSPPPLSFSLPLPLSLPHTVPSLRLSLFHGVLCYGSDDGGRRVPRDYGLVYGGWLHPPLQSQAYRASHWVSQPSPLPFHPPSCPLPPSLPPSLPASLPHPFPPSLPPSLTPSLLPCLPLQRLWPCLLLLHFCPHLYWRRDGYDDPGRACQPGHGVCPVSSHR